MRVPIIANVNAAASNALSNSDDSEIEIQQPPASEPTPSRYERLKRSARFRDVLETPRSAQAQGEEHNGLKERAYTCPHGKAFYRCVNGFTGCCSHDPCDPAGSCRDGQKASSQEEKSRTATDAEGSTTHLRSHHHTRTRHHPHQGHHTATLTSQTDSTQSTTSTSDLTTTSSTSSISTASPTKSSTSSTSSASAASGTPPACPGGNGTHYTNSTKVEYIVQCGIENTFISYNALWTGTGGYGECFSACSKTNECAGFTFVGSVSGNCYMKSQMPENLYVTHDDDKYITCTKAKSPHNTGTGGSSTTPKKAGIIAGAVIGGLIFLGLLLFLIAFCAKRYRKKVEQKRATITHVIQGPIEMQPYQPYSPPELQRQGSTSHDVYQSNGGRSPSASEAKAKSPGQLSNESRARLIGLEQTYRDEPKASPGLRPESGLIPLILPASIYRPLGSPAKQSPSDRAPGARSPRFREQLFEQTGRQRGASNLDSPTLGEQQGSDRSVGNSAGRPQYLANSRLVRSSPSPKSVSPISPRSMNISHGSGGVSPIRKGTTWREV